MGREYNKTIRRDGHGRVTRVEYRQYSPSGCGTLIAGAFIVWLCLRCGGCL